MSLHRCVDRPEKADTLEDESATATLKADDFPHHGMPERRTLGILRIG
jgi:hypothetical protein